MTGTNSCNDRLMFVLCQNVEINSYEYVTHNVFSGIMGMKSSTTWNFSWFNHQEKCLWVEISPIYDLLWFIEISLVYSLFIHYLLQLTILTLPFIKKLSDNHDNRSAVFEILVRCVVVAWMSTNFEALMLRFETTSAFHIVSCRLNPLC